MLSEEEKKELLEDALNQERQKSFKVADEKARIFAQKHPVHPTVDKIIEFLTDAQELTGPFPISKTIPTAPFNFRL